MGDWKERQLSSKAPTHFEFCTMSILYNKKCLKWKNIQSHVAVVLKGDFACQRTDGNAREMFGCYNWSWG